MLACRCPECSETQCTLILPEFEVTEALHHISEGFSNALLGKWLFITGKCSHSGLYTCAADSVIMYCVNCLSDWLAAVMPWTCAPIQFTCKLGVHINPTSDRNLFLASWSTLSYQNSAVSHKIQSGLSELADRYVVLCTLTPVACKVQSTHLLLSQCKRSWQSHWRLSRPS